MENVTEDKPICIIEVNENLRRVELGMELTRPLRQLNTNCEFKKKYEEWCNIQDGLDIDADIKKIENKDKIKAYYEKNKDKMKAYYEKNKDKINKKGKAYYEKNKDKINKKGKAYREKNKDKMNKKGKAYYEKNKDKINKKRRLNYKLKHG